MLQRHDNIFHTVLLIWIQAQGELSCTFSQRFLWLLTLRFLNEVFESYKQIHRHLNAHQKMSSHSTPNGKNATTTTIKVYSDVLPHIRFVVTFCHVVWFKRGRNVNRFEVNPLWSLIRCFHPWELNLYPVLALVTSQASLFSVCRHSIALSHAGIRVLSHLAQPWLSPWGCFARNLFLIRHSAPPPVIKDPINGAEKKVKHLNNGDSCFPPFKKIYSYCYQLRTVLQTGAYFRPCLFWQFD